MSNTTNNETTDRTWTCEGGVHGPCGKVHHSLSEAMLCCMEDYHAVYPPSALKEAPLDRFPVLLSGPDISEEEWPNMVNAAYDEALARANK